MPKQIHILNGDALKQQFPKQITGEIIVMRECLVDGPVQGDNLHDFYATRAEFISNNFGGTKEEYEEKSAFEINKILEIDGDADINLWFEDDLFCQVNLWFVVDQLYNQGQSKGQIFLIRPEKLTPYGFGGLSESELLNIYQNRTSLSQTDRISMLWRSYQEEDTDRLLELSIELEALYPFIRKAAEAHMARIPKGDNPDRPTQSLMEIMKELNTKEFGPIFREFNQREAIYGFGDLQVKRIYDQILNNGLQ